MKKAVLGTIFLLGLLYLIWPGPGSINDIHAIPDSKKSDEPGDTVQVGNLSAYFSLYKRDFITDFYYKDFSYLNILGIKIPAIRFNHPVEQAKISVRDQIQTTYIEEYSYPLRDSLFVNGYDKDVWNKLNHIRSDKNNEVLVINGEIFNSKTTIRYYSSPILLRIIIYIGIWIVSIKLFKVSLQALKKY